MPSSSTASDLHSSTSHTSTGTMSVAVLPPAQSAIYSPMPIFTAPTAPKSPSKRPKLSLNTSSTSNAPYLSKQSTSLRIETLSATSPTTINTFGNAYARPLRSSKPALPVVTRKDSAGPDTPVEQAIVIASASPVSATYEIEPTAEIIPYTLGYDVNSILLNGPTDRKRNRLSPKSQSKPIFSLTKRVIFRAPLTEEVKNKQYTLRHSDITSITNTPCSAMAREAVKSSMRKLSLRTTPIADNAEEEEEDDDEEHETNEEQEDATMSDCPATPVAGRNKKDRHWYWTLGPERFNGGEPIHGSGTVASPTQL